MVRGRPAAPDDVKAAAFERVQAAMPKGVQAVRDLAAEKGKPSHLCIMLKWGWGERPWAIDLVRQELTEDVLEGFKRSHAFAKGAGA